MNNMGQQPSMADVGAMADIMGALDDVESGKASQQMNEAIRMGKPADIPDGMQDIAAMKGILTDLYDVAGPELNAPQPVAEHIQPSHNIQPQPFQQSSDDMSYEEYLAMSQGKQLTNADPATGQPVTQNINTNGKEWVLVSEKYNNTSSMFKHTVKHSLTGLPILTNVVMKESAAALCNLLNEGKTLDDPKILGIISSGVQYTRLVEGLITSMRSRQQVLRESNYSAAAKCDEKIAKQKADAAKLKDDLRDYLNTHRISYK